MKRGRRKGKTRAKKSGRIEKSKKLKKILKESQKSQRRRDQRREYKQEAQTQSSSVCPRLRKEQHLRNVATGAYSFNFFNFMLVCYFSLLFWGILFHILIHVLFIFLKNSNWRLIETKFERKHRKQIGIKNLYWKQAKVLDNLQKKKYSPVKK